MMDEKKYSIVIETLMQMYKDKLITIAKVKATLNDKKITLDEYNYILGKIEKD